jgi:hypothetical protein
MKSQEFGMADQNNVSVSQQPTSISLAGVPEGWCNGAMRRAGL